MKRTFIIVFLALQLLSLASCASNTSTTQEQKKQTDWGTVNTIESEGVRR